MVVFKYILEIILSSGNTFYISSQSIACPFIFLMASFKEQKLIVMDEDQFIYIFFFTVVVLWCKKPFSTPRLQRFSLKSCTDLSFTFSFVVNFDYYFVSVCANVVIWYPFLYSGIYLIQQHLLKPFFSSFPSLWSCYPFNPWVYRAGLIKKF